MESFGNYNITEIMESHTINKRKAKVLSDSSSSENPSNKAMKPNQISDSNLAAEVICLFEPESQGKANDAIHCKLNEKLKVSDCSEILKNHIWSDTKIFFYKDQDQIDHDENLTTCRLRFNDTEIVNNQKFLIKKKSSKDFPETNSKPKKSDEAFVTKKKDAKLIKRSILRELFAIHDIDEFTEGSKPEMKRLDENRDPLELNTIEDATKKSVKNNNFKITDEMLENIFQSSEEEDEELTAEPAKMMSKNITIKSSLSAAASKIVNVRKSSDFNDLVSSIVNLEPETINNEPAKSFNKENVAMDNKEKNQQTGKQVKAKSSSKQLSLKNWLKPVQKTYDEDQTSTKPQPTTKPMTINPVKNSLDQMFKLNKTPSLNHNKSSEATSKCQSKVEQAYFDVFNTSTSGNKSRLHLKTLSERNCLNFTDDDEIREKKLKKLKDNKNLDYEEFCRVKFSD